MPKVRGKLTREKTMEKLAREVDLLQRLQVRLGAAGKVVWRRPLADTMG